MILCTLFKQSEQELGLVLPYGFVCGDFSLGIVCCCSHLAFSYLPHGSFFLYLIC